MFGFTPREIPAELREPRIVLGQDFLTRKVFLQATQTETVTRILSKIGTVDDIAVGELDSSQGIDVVIAGKNGAIITDYSGVKRLHTMYDFEIEKRKFSIFDFPNPHTLLGDIRIIDIEGDQVCEYLGRGSTDGAAIFAHDGKRLWSYVRTLNEKTSIEDLAPGDVNGDGILEFIAGWNSWNNIDKDRIALLDRYGKQKWTEPVDYIYSQAEVVDVNGDGKNEIIHSNGSNMTIRNAQGSILKVIKMPFYFSHFALCNAPGTNKPHILAVEDGAIWLTDFEGKVTARFDAPLSKVSVTPYKTPPLDIVWDSESVYKAKGTLVKFSDTGPEYLAIIANFAVIERSLLYLFSAEGKLVYQEVIPAECNAIAVLPKSEGKMSQALLVGGEQIVWRYDVR